jgi:signal transduction histidine kinase
MADWVNLVAGVTQIAIAIAVLFELTRLRRGFPWVAILLIAFFVADGLVAINRPDSLLGSSATLDAVLTIIDMVVLIGLLVFVRRLVRGALQTVEEAKLRAHEYERARRDYARLLRHRIANPLMTIGGAARTLRAKRGDEAKREQLLESIIEASTSLERISLEPRPKSAEEIDLEPAPKAEELSANRR